MEKAEEDTLDETFRKFWGSLFKHSHSSSSPMGLSCLHPTPTTAPPCMATMYFIRGLLFYSMNSSNIRKLSEQLGTVRTVGNIQNSRKYSEYQ